MATATMNAKPEVGSVVHVCFGNSPIEMKVEAILPDGRVRLSTTTVAAIYFDHGWDGWQVDEDQHWEFFDGRSGPHLNRERELFA